MYRIISIIGIVIGVLITANVALAGLDHGTTIDSFVVAMAMVSVQARSVIRVSDLYKYTGLKRSQIEELIKRKILNPFVPAPGARVRIVFSDEVARLQTMQAEAAKAEAAAQAAAGEKPIEIAPNRGRSRKRIARETAENAETAA
jgi:signal transduction histidine kinase